MFRWTQVRRYQFDGGLPGGLLQRPWKWGLQRMWGEPKVQRKQQSGQLQNVPCWIIHRGRDHGARRVHTHVLQGVPRWFYLRDFK